MPRGPHRTTSVIVALGLGSLGYGLVTEVLTPEPTLKPRVFFLPDGSPIRYFRRAWVTATKNAGCDGRLLHDLRRTFARNAERGGVPRSMAMKLTGHKSEKVYWRYAIVSEADQREGTRKAAAARLRHNQAHETR